VVGERNVVAPDIELSCKTCVGQEREESVIHPQIFSAAVFWSACDKSKTPDLPATFGLMRQRRQQEKAAHPYDSLLKHVRYMGEETLT
jgi:hypothetical protein